VDPSVGQDVSYEICRHPPPPRCACSLWLLVLSVSLHVLYMCVRFGRINLGAVDIYAVECYNFSEIFVFHYTCSSRLARFFELWQRRRFFFVCA
jgi:hypothetical protein